MRRKAYGGGEERVDREEVLISYLIFGDRCRGTRGFRRVEFSMALSGSLRMYGVVPSRVFPRENGEV